MSDENTCPKGTRDTCASTHRVAPPVVHAEGAGAAAEPVAFGAEVLPVAGAAEHLAGVLGDAPSVYHLPAVGWNQEIRNFI